MFCQNCGAQLPDNAKFCGSCGAQINGTSGGETTSGTYDANAAQNNGQQSGTQGEYKQQSYNTQQTYSQPTYNAQPVSYGAPKKSGFCTASLIVLIGAGLCLLGYFLPLISYYGAGFSLFDLTFGTGLASGYASIPMVVFLVAGGLAVLFAFTKPGLTIISALLGIGGFVYLFVGTTASLGQIMSSLFQVAGIGMYLTAASIIVMIVGGIMGMTRK